MPILASGNWRDAAPTWAASKRYIALNDVRSFDDGYKELLDTLLGMTHGPPPLGSPSGFDDLEQALPVLQKASEDWELIAARGPVSHDALIPQPVFEQLSYLHRRELSPKLNSVERGFALLCSIQHGVDVQFWLQVNKSNSDAPRFVVQPIKWKHRRSALRAGYVIEHLDEAIREEAVRQGSEEAGALAHRVTSAASDGRTESWWDTELRSDPALARFVDELLSEVR